MLKSEMTQMGSLVLRAAGVSSVPAGEALAVDRDVFAQTITRTLTSHPNITLIREEATAPAKQGVTILASGPLTSDDLAKWITRNTRGEGMYFYDAMGPIVDASTIDMDRAFLANRYGKGAEEAYLNCPMTDIEYYAFVDALLSAEKVAPRSFEKEILFQGCQPIESIAATGRDSLRFGPMKPVGLTDPRTGQRPFAVVQLRAEDRARTSFNLVGFQTKLKYPEQGRVFRMIPALRNAEFLRLGSIHRNTYLRSPEVLRADLSLKGHPLVYFAGQITGVEGYLESAATGLLAGLFAYQRAVGKTHCPPPANTVLGALLRHVTGSNAENYQPANAHFGLLDPAYFEGASLLKRDEARELMAKQATAAMSEWWSHAV